MACFRGSRGLAETRNFHDKANNKARPRRKRNKNEKKKKEEEDEEDEEGIE